MKKSTVTITETFKYTEHDCDGSDLMTVRRGNVEFGCCGSIAENVKVDVHSRNYNTTDNTLAKVYDCCPNCGEETRFTFKK